MSGIKGSLHVQEYVYDFAADGGAIGQIDLSAKATKDPVPVGAVVKDVRAKVLTALTSGGSAVLSWGDGADADGYSGTAVAVASMTANALFNGQEDAAAPGALLYSTIGTTPASLKAKGGHAVTNAATGQVKFTIATAALTAGKIVFMVEYYLPAASA